jgi:hypothetical protein
MKTTKKLQGTEITAVAIMKLIESLDNDCIEY